MNQTKRLQILSFLLIFLAACSQPEFNTPERGAPVFEIAFMPDVHFHDLFADFESGSFDGLPVTYRGEEKQAVIRTMEAQLNSTRLFNENYFAFLAALDDIAERGIKYVGLPGDFSDDGQPAHILGLAEILTKYRDKHGISFFLTPGNHDPTRPYATEAGKRDYLGEGGMRQPVFSQNHPMCLESHESNGQVNENVLPESHKVACTDDVLELGYNGLYGYLGEFGPLPIGDEIYYETPFSGKQNDSHSHEDRIYEVCHEGSGGEYREPDYTNCFGVPDMSYLVEPVEGVWLLALDTNVYIPRKDADQMQINNGKNFYGSGNAGYNKVITHKKHLIPWMADVARRAKKKDKKLISFSHFPAADFYNGAGPLIEEVWGEDEFQMVRMPKPATTQSIAATGIGLHIAGHMHMNGMEIATDEISGKVLTNIQVPSLAAYVPAYKIVRMFEDSNSIEVETVILDKVPDFDTLFSLYEQEWYYLNHIGYERIWNKNILDSGTYLDFTDWHIRELSRLRFLPGEWPEYLRKVLKTTNGHQLLIAANLPTEVWYQNSWGEILMKVEQTNIDMISTESDLNDFDYAAKKANNLAQNHGLKLIDFESWDGNILSIDFYRIRNAGELALKHIPEERIIHYSIIASALREKTGISNLENKNVAELQRSIHSVFEVMSLFSNRLPSEHSLINLETGKVTPVVERR